MLESHHVEELICTVSSMDRATVVDQLLQFPKRYATRFPTDFTAAFLADLPTDRLKHIFVALCLKNAHLPETATDRHEAAAA